jgi:hypothetical protein
MDLSYGRSPFPFSDRPVLPHIDAYQDNDKLKHSRDELNVSPISKSHHIGLNNNTLYGYFPVKQIKVAYKFIKSCGDDESYGVTLDELESAFRRVKRAIKNRDEEYLARRLMTTFEFLLKIKSRTPKMWFKENDTSQSNRGDGKLTWMEFEAGMNKLCTDLGAALFTKHDLAVILKYLDPNGDGDLSYQEVNKGFQRIHRIADCKAVMLNSGPIMPYLQDFMSNRQIRVRDLFNFLDIKSKKQISFEVFCEGIERIGAFMGPNAASRPSSEPHPLEVHTDLIEQSEITLKSVEEFRAPLSAGSYESERKQRAKELQHRSAMHLPPVRGITPASLSREASQGSIEKGYEKQVRKHFREYDDWLKQFDRKLHNGLILMSKM